MAPRPDAEELRLVERVVADLRAEADRHNEQAAAQAKPGGSPDLRRRHQLQHEELRKLANRYERWAKEGVDVEPG
jgi:hypothetical protein